MSTRRRGPRRFVALDRITREPLGLYTGMQALLEASKAWPDEVHVTCLRQGDALALAPRVDLTVRRGRLLDGDGKVIAFVRGARMMMREDLR